MALQLPFPPLVILDRDDYVAWDVIATACEGRFAQGVSVCLRHTTGHDDRGGYFFHIQNVDGTYVFRTFDRQRVCAFGSVEECERFINHAAGRRYDEAMWVVAQRANLRVDEIP